MEIYTCVDEACKIIKTKTISENEKFKMVKELLQKQNPSCIFEIINFKMYLIFRLACLYCNSIELPIYLTHTYFIPLGCKYYGPFINACCNGNKKLIDFFIDRNAFNWEIKYFQPVRYLLKHPDLFWHYYEKYKFNISFDNNYVFKTICCKGSQTLNTFKTTEAYLSLAKKIYDTIKDEISDTFVLKKCLIYSNLEFFKWYEEILDYKIQITQESNLFFRNACIQGKQSLVKHILESENYLEVYHNIYMSPIIKTCCIYCQVDIIKLIFDYMDPEYLFFNFTSHFEDFSSLKGTNEQIQNLVLYFYYKNEISQEYLISCLMNAIYDNDLFLADLCNKLITNQTKQIWSNFMQDKINKKKKLKKSAIDWMKDKFPNIQLLFEKKSYLDTFADSIIENDFELSKKLYTDYESKNDTIILPLISSTNVNYIFHHACMNGNNECAQWILEMYVKNNKNQNEYYPFFLINNETITHICETGNLYLFELISMYLKFTNLPKYFSTACANNKVILVEYMFNKYNYLLNLEEIFVQFIYCISLYDALEIYHWFSKKINLKEIFKKSYAIRNLVIENMCSENNFELFTYMIKFFTIDIETVKNILKWGNKFQNYNLIYYVLDTYKYYNIDCNFILKNCILNKNYFILFDTFTSFFTKNNFDYDTIDLCTEDSIYNNSCDAFQVLFLKLQTFSDYSIQNTYEYFDLANEKSKTNMYYCKFIFNNQNIITKYNLIKRSSVTSSPNLYFLDWVYYLKDAKWHQVLNYDYDFDEYIFVDVIKEYIDSKEYNKIVDFLHSNVMENLSTKTECVICQENIASILSNCRHMYCYECFFNFTYKYENNNCAFCRQNLEISKCVFYTIHE